MTWRGLLSVLVLHVVLVPIAVSGVAVELRFDVESHHVRQALGACIIGYWAGTLLEMLRRRLLRHLEAER